MNKLAMRTTLFILWLLVTHCSIAQVGESLLVGPGDLLHIQVLDTPELDQHVRVTDAGLIVLLSGGEVKVAGLTPGAAASRVESILISSGMLRHPHVSVSVDEFATQKVTVMGEVRNPGVYSIETPRSVLDVLTLAGGINDFADRQILIKRHGTGEKVRYFISNDANVAAETSLKVDPGDTVIVPHAGIVYVLGDVRTPGGYTLTNNAGQLSILQLVARAGGANTTARNGKMRLLRKTPQGYAETQLSLLDMEKGKIPDMLLGPDDIVYLPFSIGKNFLINSSGIAAQLGSAAVYRF